MGRGERAPCGGVSGGVRAELAQPGECYVVHDRDPDQDDWSLWQRSECGTKNIMLVSWQGEIREGSRACEEDVNEWPTSMIDIGLHKVRPENIAGMIMAARHMRDKGAWFRFARRQSERQALDTNPAR